MDPPQKKSNDPFEELNFVKDKESMKNFLRGFDQGKYMDQIKNIKQRKQQIMGIKLDDVEVFLGKKFVDKCILETQFYTEMFTEVIDEILWDDMKDVKPDEEALDCEDNLIQLRMNQLDRMNEASGQERKILDVFPGDLIRRHEVFILPRETQKVQAIRTIESSQMGNIVKTKGIVTRVSDVQPMVRVACYSCTKCGQELYATVPNKEYTPIDRCTSEVCQASNGSGESTLVHQHRGSKFIKYQEAKLQEEPDQVPTGHIPRSVTIELLGELTRQIQPGETITVSGAFLPAPVKRRSGRSSGLLHGTMIKASGIKKHMKDFSELDDDAVMEKKVLEVHNDPSCYERLASSIAPEIFGMEDIKKALLLMMIGGVTKEMSDGMRIRGDINICMMGDPGVAKSQLLKHITRIAPRAVFTTGKGSSGVGLTAAVVRDPVTDDVTLEGGALVMADMGICCIDEFDKMDESDRTAIHEVMEQQTVSIAKAGIVTTLNARTAVLAAANPMFGRYNRKLSPEKNINLPAALLSRFDLMFLLLDNPNTNTDQKLSDHVVDVHKNHEDYGNKPKFDRNGNVIEEQHLTADEMRCYIAKARNFEPVVPDDENSMDDLGISGYISEQYTSMRQADQENATNAGQQHNMTARMLLCILRLSQAHARVRFSNTIERCDVEEAIRLIDSCRAGLNEDENVSTFVVNDTTSSCFDIINKKMVEYKSRTGKAYVPIAEANKLVIQAGQTDKSFKAAIDEYVGQEIWVVDESHGVIRYLDPADDM